MVLLQHCEEPVQASRGIRPRFCGGRCGCGVCQQRRLWRDPDSLLTLGIPGDGCVAIMLSALMINGLNPGLSLFTTDGAIMYAIMLGLILVNIFMFLQGKYLTSLFAKVVSIPQQILTPSS